MLLTVKEHYTTGCFYLCHLLLTFWYVYDNLIYLQYVQLYLLQYGKQIVQCVGTYYRQQNKANYYWLPNIAEMLN